MLVSFEKTHVELAALGEGRLVGVEAAGDAPLVRNVMAEVGWLAKADFAKLDSTPTVAQGYDLPQGVPQEEAVGGVFEAVAVGVADGQETTGEAAVEVFESQPYFASGKTVLADGSARGESAACARSIVVMWRMHAPTAAVEFSFHRGSIPKKACVLKNVAD